MADLWPYHSPTMGGGKSRHTSVGFLFKKEVVWLGGFHQSNQEAAMGVIVTFPKTTRAPPKTRQRKKRGPWVFADLKGKKPKGHAPVRLGPRGRVLIAEGQVWVGGHNQRLWVTQELVLAKHRKGSLYPHDIILTAYRGKEMRILAETTVRLTMKVWEMYIISQKELMKKFDHMSRHDPQSPFRGRKDAAWAARRSFGLDEKGNRIR